MNPYPINNSTQNQRDQNSNYRPGPTTNQFQAPINNFNHIIPKYSPQLSIPSGYNPVNIISPQINPTYQQNNIRVSPSNQNANIIQPQHLNQNTQNMMNNQSPIININSPYIGQNQIPMQNHTQPYAPIINSNIIQGKFNQVLPINTQNNIIQGINQINLGNNSNESRIKNNLIKNSVVIKNELMNEHPPIPIKLSIKAMKSICKISYLYNNKLKF